MKKNSLAGLTSINLSQFLLSRHLGHRIFGTVLMDPLGTHVDRIFVMFSDTNPTPNPVPGFQNFDIFITGTG